MRRHKSRRHPPWIVSLLAIGLFASGCTAGPSATGAGGRDGSAASGAQGEGLLGEIQTAGVIRVANTQANPPFSFLDQSNNVVGYDVDVANEIARRLGVGNVEFVRGTFQAFIAGLETDKWDVVIAGLTPTEERRQQVDFTCPYQVNGVSIFVRSGDDSISGLGDLPGRSVGVSAGTTQEELAGGIEGADVRTYQNATLGLTDLSQGGVDTMLVSRFQGTYLSERNGLQVQPAGELLEREVNGMTFAKDSPAFKQAVDEALAEMIDDGTLTEISGRWLGGQDMAEQLRQLPADQNR